MNIRERLEGKILRRKLKGSALDSADYKFLPDDFFLNSENINEYILKPAAAKRNIIFVCRKSFDNYVIAECIKTQYELNNQGRLVQGVNIQPNPDIMAAAKMFEEAMQGAQPFIMGINFADSRFIINKLTALFALNFRNLTPSDTAVLIGAANPVIVYILKDEAGMFYISDAEEISLNEAGSALETSRIFKKKQAVYTPVKKFKQAIPEFEDFIELEQDEKSKETIADKETEIKTEIKAPAHKLKKNIKRESVQKIEKNKKTAADGKKALNSSGKDNAEIMPSDISRLKGKIKAEEADKKETAQVNISEKTTAAEKNNIKIKSTESEKTEMTPSKAAEEAQVINIEQQVYETADVSAADKQAEQYLKSEEKYTSEETGRKINKYQMLKEKAMRRKRTQQ